MRRVLLTLALLVPAACAPACAGCTKSKQPEATDKGAPTAAAPTATGAPAPTAEKGAAEAAGPRAEGQGFLVVVTPPAAAAVNSEATARVTLSPKAGYHVNKDFPTSLKVAAPAGVTCAKPEQKAEDAKKLEETEAEFAVACTAQEAGEKQFDATFKFAVCTATTCDPKTEKLSWKVAAK